MTPLRLRALALFSLLFAVLIPHLSQLNYGFGSLEMLAATLVAMLAGAALAFVCGSRISFGIIFGAIVYFFLDSFFLETEVALVSFACCVLILFVLLKYMPIALPLAVVVFGLVFALPSFVAPVKPPLERRAAQAEPERPESDLAYLHIILDEQMSLTARVPGIPQAIGSEKVLESYQNNGFKLYTHADSNWGMTVKALPAMFGLSEDLDNYVVEEGHPHYQFGVDDNLLLGRLLGMGFTPTVIETDYLRLCSPDPRTACDTYRVGLDMSVVRDLDISLAQRFRLALLALHSNYMWYDQQVYIYQLAAEAIADLRGRPKPSNPQFFTSPLSNLNILDDLAARVASMEPGDAIIAHLLVPHFPYVLDRECQFRDVEVWENPLRFSANTDALRAYEAFWDQSICVHSKIDDILAAVADRDDIVIVVHGDHGARITSDSPDQKTNDLLASMLAIKGPMIAAETLTSPVALQATFATEFEAIFGSR